MKQNNIFQEDPGFKYLTLAVLLICLFLTIKEVILKPKRMEVAPLPQQKVSLVPINLKLLETGVLKQLAPFEKITLPEDLGRDDPFAPF